MKTWIAALGLLFTLSFSSFAAGLIVVEEPPLIHPTRPPRPVLPEPRPLPQPVPSVYPLEVVKHQVEVKIDDQVAATVIEQEFHNSSAQRLEGTFMFPAPKGAHLSGFTMEIDGKPMEAELLAGDKARQIYEDIVRKAKDPALLEYAGRDLYKVRIFPIEPNSTRRIKLSYTQVLAAHSGLASYVYPLNTTRFSSRPVQNLSVKIELASRQPLKSIYSPSHSVEIKRHGDRRATIGFEAKEVRSDADFQVFFGADSKELDFNLLTYQDGKDEGYFLLLASPGANVRNSQLIAKDVVFVLDTSGSMAGKKLEQAKKALQFCVENLQAEDRFEILRFSTEVEPLFNTLTSASKANREKAASFIDELKPIGGTAIDAALQRAFALRSSAQKSAEDKSADRPLVVIFLTDGLPTVGNSDEETIVSGVKKASGGNVRVFCFGIGLDVNTHLLDRITEETRAFSQYVLPDEDLEIKVSSFFERIKAPVLTNPELSFPDNIRVSKLYPSPLPDVFHGDQIVVVGRYSGKGRGELKLNGNVNGKKKTLTDEVKFAVNTREHDFIPRLWATRRIGYLMDEIRLRGENAELRDEVVTLARQYNVVTPYTAYLIVEDEARRGVAESTQSFEALSRDSLARKSVADNFHFFSEAKTGAQAVGDARYGRALKSAQNTVDALSLADTANRYALQTPAEPAAAAATGRSFASTSSESQQKKEASERLSGYTQQTRYLNGRSFYQNGAQWVDSQVQFNTNANRVQIAFNSKEYFELVANQPEARPWLALGQNVQFVLNNSIYEITAP